MKIAVGTKNPAKVHAVQELFLKMNAGVQSVEVPSGVSSQPFSDEETVEGAVNRAKAALQITESDLGFGLEGGVTETTGGLMLCNWGALVNKQGQVWLASGAKILLPFDVARSLREGRELGDIMAELTADHDIRKKEGAIGVFTAGRITRKQMFLHIVEMLYGQYEYNQQEWKH
ncbi:DUF84 family protein [Alkalihalobacillus pseudalcaliphilus]|uniref:DUF84 family protein n=1 Tax=Alkalihalobacillus pseudalcaliphilus TaxID=79884 RepID=UPI00064D8414|nr:DUF84 family protein [Alkalihalobacillus pseudalcaliphilus]KMK77801.1 NTPase [Alkalihalobacillus pseudalcaliphilus]